MNPGPNYRRVLFYAGLLLLFVLQIPAIVYSLMTPFALNDDYESWYQLRDQATWSGNVAWLRNIFFNFTDVVRFRPTYEFYNLVTWAGFGTSPAWHHLARLLLKAGIAWYGIRTLRRCSTKGVSRSAIFLFLAVFLFFPNCPEARLAPVETTQALFLAAMIYYLLKMHAARTWSLQPDYFKLLFSFWMLSWSKETSIGFLLGAIVAMLPRIRSFKGAWLLTPFVLVFIFLLAKIRVISHGAGYGTAPVTRALIKTNLAFYPRAVVLWDTSAAISILFCALVVAYFAQALFHRRSQVDAAEGSGPRFAWLLEKELFGTSFVFAMLLGYLLLCCTFWLTVLRYFYPAVFLLALLSALCVQGIEQAFRNGLSTRMTRLFFRNESFVTILAAVFGCYFVATNYYNFLYQYAGQYHCRVVENRLLDEISKLRSEKKIVYLGEDSEIRVCFNEYLPFFFGIQDRRALNIQSNQLLDEDSYYVTIEQHAPMGQTLYKRFEDDTGAESLLQIGRRASALLQARGAPFTWIDAGASELPAQSWQIYHYTNCELLPTKESK